jgi:hypothetical protein
MPMMLEVKMWRNAFPFRTYYRGSVSTVWDVTGRETEEHGEFVRN